MTGHIERFLIFNIWLNKIHLCKQTQDKAITKPNKQENSNGLLHSQAMGWDWFLSSVAITLVQRSVWSHVPFSWAAESHHFPLGTDQQHKKQRREKQPEVFKRYLHIVHWSIGFHANRVSPKCYSSQHLQKSFLIFLKNIGTNGFKLEAELQAWCSACEKYVYVCINSASWFWSLECMVQKKGEGFCKNRSIRSEL